MFVRYQCPRCSGQQRAEVTSGALLQCGQCDWTRTVAEFTTTGHPSHCGVCGCTDLWRQKDFPQRLGVGMVALGAVASTVAVAYYMPATALGILLFFAFADLLLYTLMPDVLVCYRCAARYQDPAPRAQFPTFNLDTAERYRQEAARVAEARAARGSAGTAVESVEAGPEIRGA